MRIVIIGAGKIGTMLAKVLSDENHDIVLVDTNKSKVKYLSESLDIMTVLGNGAELNIQREANVGESDLLIAVTAQDEVNMVACILARNLGCQNTIARVRNLAYAEQLHLMRDELGLSMVINPELLAAKEIFRLLQIPAFIKRDTFAEGKAELVELEIGASSPLNGLKLSDMRNRIDVQVLICAVNRDNNVFIPDGNFVLNEGDKIYVASSAASLVSLTHKLRLRSKKGKDVLIVGGGRIAEFLAPMLVKAGTRVIIIEQDMARCEYLVEKIPRAQIICADGSEQSVLRAHDIEQMDAVVPLTNMDEENIIIAMFARKTGVPQVLTKINRSEYGEILGDRGADSLISPMDISSYEIVRYVRAAENTGGSSVLTVHKLAASGAEAMEFQVTAATNNLGRPLKDISLKPGILIACIIHRGKVIIPGGSDFLSDGDTVVIVTTAGRKILDLNDIFVKE